MKAATLGSYIQKLFGDGTLLSISALGACLYSFFFPTEQYLYGASAVLGIMVLDLITKLYALYKQGGGWKKAVRSRKINSACFYQGTIDKLIVFGVMLCICGFAYRLTIISAVAVWFTQVVFILMFLRDALSIIENLTDAGIKGLGIFEKVIKKKMDDYVDMTEEPDGNADSKSSTTSSGDNDSETPI